MPADDRPQTAFARLGRRTADLLRPFAWVAAAIGLLIAAIPPAPQWQEYEAEAWAVPPVRATVAWLPESDWHPAAATFTRLNEVRTRDLSPGSQRVWEFPAAGLRLRREIMRLSNWEPYDPKPPEMPRGFGSLPKAELAKLAAWQDGMGFHFIDVAEVSLWAVLLPALLVAGWRAWRPPEPSGPPGLLRRLVRPWVWAFALLGGAAIAGPFARVWLPTDTPWWAVNGQIGPATTPHPRLIAIEADWALGPPSPPVERLLRAQTGCRGLGVWMTAWAYPIGGGMGGLGGGTGAVRGHWRANRMLQISLLWLLLPAELANLVTLFRPRPRRLAPDMPPVPA